MRKKGKKEKHKKLRKKTGLSIVSFFVFTVFLSVKVYAEGTADEYINVYKNNADILENNSIISSAIRSLLWYITKAIVFIADASEKLYDTAFGFIDITLNEKVSAFIDAFKPVIVGIMALSLLYLGFVFILSHDKKPNLAINICIFALVVTMGTTLFAELNSGILAFKTGVDSITDKKNSSQVYKVIDDNLIDLVDIASLDGSKFKSLVKLDYAHANKNSKDGKDTYYHSGINRETFSQIDYNEVLNYDAAQFNWDTASKKILQNKLNVVVPGKKFTTREVYNGFGWNSGDDADMGNEFYYRYKFHFLNAWISLIALIIIYITMSYKCVRVEFELVVARLLAFLYSAELSGGEKIKKILVFIRDSYILLCITVICIKVYGIMTGIIHSRIDNGFVEAVFVLFTAFAVIDGPNLVERLLGLDAGLKSSAARLLAAYGAAKGAAKGVRSGAKGASQKIFGTKSAPPMPNDGKRHGGIIDKLNGKEKEAKEIGKKEWQDRKNKGSNASSSSASTGTSEGEQPGKSSGDNNPGNAGEKPDVNNSKSSSFMNSKDKHSGSNAGSFMNNKRQEPRSTMPRKSIKNHSKYMDKNSTRGDK
jgi:hypothetical protein